MAGRPIHIYVSGVSGCGKTYRRCAWYLIKEFLPEYDGVHWSNFPLGEVPKGFQPVPPRYEGETFAERIAEEVSKRTGRPFDEFVNRIRLIPDEVLATWVTGESGPWDFFEDKDLSGAHIAIDEIHKYCGSSSPRKVRNRWKLWLGELRKNGATIEFISQYSDKVAREIRQEAACSIQLVPAEHKRDGFFRIRYSDWYELRAMITGVYDVVTWEIEKRNVDGRMVVEHCCRWRHDPFYYAFYNTQELAGGAGGRSGQGALHQFERRSKPGLLLWFVRRNVWQLFSRGCIIALLVWVTMFGGGGFLVNLMVERISGYTSAGIKSGQVQAEGVRTNYEGSNLGDVGGGGVGGVLSGPASGAMAAQSAALGEAQGRIEALQAERERLLGEVARYEERVAELAALVLVTPSTVMFRGGYEYEVGEVVDVGPYAGQSIEAVDYERRAVRLSDGRVVRMGSPMRVVGMREVDRNGSDGAAVPPGIRRGRAGVESSGVGGG